MTVKDLKSAIADIPKELDDLEVITEDPYINELGSSEVSDEPVTDVEMCKARYGRPSKDAYFLKLLT